MENKRKGISLIVAVISIIIILILATVVILAFNEKNTIKKASEAKFKSDMKNLLSQANVNIMSELFTEDGKDIAQREIYGDEVYEKFVPEAKDKYVVGIYKGRLAIDVLDYSEEQVNWAREVGILIRDMQITDFTCTTTTTSIKIDVLVKDESKIEKYKYRVVGTGSDGVWKESDKKTFTFNGLKVGTQYYVEVKTQVNGRDTDSLSKDIKTEGFSDLVIIKISPNTWAKSATISLSYPSTPIGYMAQYKIGNSEWRQYTGSNCKITENAMLSARLYSATLDHEIGVNSLDVTTIDIEEPNNTKFTLLPEEDSVLVEISDKLSGVNLDNTRYTISRKDTPAVADIKQWTRGEYSMFTSVSEKIPLNVSNGTYYIHTLITDNAGNIKITVSEPIEVNYELPDITTSVAPPGGTLYTDSRGNSAPIPYGFTVSTVAGEKTIDEGLVVRRGANQFVWIPVPDITEMYDEKTKRGKLYDFGADGTMTLKPDCLTTTTGIREPAAINDLNGYNFPLSLMQDEFNRMITSVKKYKGFYMGRFETDMYVSDGGTVYIYSQSGGTVGRWSVLFTKAYQGTYSMLNDSTIQNYAQTCMVWGCQWDATLRWLSKYKDIGDYIVKGRGNFYDTAFFYNEYPGIKRANDSGFIKTGLTEYSRVKNIYDMAGNVSEATLTVDNGRIIARGGSNYGIVHAPASDYTEKITVGAGTSLIGGFGVGTRSMMYVK